jgi:hypothetical protein
MPVPTGSSSNPLYAVSPVGTVVTGPLIGAQVTGNFVVPIVASKTDFLCAIFQAPCDMRLERISWVTVNGSDGTTTTDPVVTAASTLKFQSSATAAVGGTSLLSAASVAWNGNTVDFIAPSGEVAGTSTVTLSTVAGVRDIAKGTFIMCAYKTGAGLVTGSLLHIKYTWVLNGFSNVNGTSN